MWNKLTLANSNKLENMQWKFANRFILSNLFCKYESMLKYLRFIPLCFRRQNLDAVHLISVFENKTDCCSHMDTAGLGVLTKQIRVFSTLNVSNVSRLSPSTRRVTAANNICRSLNVFNKHNTSV
jgi:hypothetical protein